MKTLGKTIAGFLVLALTFVIAGCFAGKAEVSKKCACEAFDKYGAQELDEYDDFTRIFNNRSLSIFSIFLTSLSPLYLIK